MGQVLQVKKLIFSSFSLKILKSMIEYRITDEQSIADTILYQRKVRTAMGQHIG